MALVIAFALAFGYLTVGRNKKVIAEYIRNQLAEDKISDQISIKEYFDPFTGEQVTKSK